MAVRKRCSLDDSCTFGTTMNDDQTELIEDSAATDAVDYAGKKRRIIRMLLAYSAILGVISIFLPEENTPIDFVVGLPLLILGISWCFTDASEHGHRIGKVMRFMLILAFFVGFPLYLVQTRGIRGLKTLSLTVLLVAFMATCMMATALATLYGGNALGFVDLVD